MYTLCILTIFTIFEQKQMETRSNSQYSPCHEKCLPMGKRIYGNGTQYISRCNISDINQMVQTRGKPVGFK